MKNFIIVLALFYATSSFSQTTNEAVEHMNKVTAPVNDLKKEIWQYLKSVTKGKGAKKVEKTRQSLIARTSSVKSQVKRAGGLKGDYSLRDGMVNYLEMSYTVLKEDYDKILNMEEIAEQSYDLMEAYLMAQEKAGEKLDQSSQQYKEVEKGFAEKYGITMVDGAEKDKTWEKIKKANEALKYYNQVYLIFFKAYKQEFYLLDAIGRADVSAMKQNANALAEFSNEGIAKLKEIGSYKGDASIKTSANRTLQFYKREGETDVESIINFFVSKDEYEKHKKIIETTKKKDLKTEDIDKYNKAIEAYNKSVASYNTKNESLNKRRSEMLETWNKSVGKFFDLHSN